MFSDSLSPSLSLSVCVLEFEEHAESLDAQFNTITATSGNY